VVVAGIIILSFLTLMVLHCLEILGYFKKPDTCCLAWFYALGLEVGTAFSRLHCMR
jgi:hypothetical protein